MYSVLNQKTRAYDYYESGETEPWHAPAPPRSRGASALGAIPEDAAWPLPSGAKKVGEGMTARGRIAVARAGGMGLGDVEPAIMAAGAIALMVGGLAILTKAAGGRR